MISRSHGNSCRPGNRTYGRSLSQNPGRRSVPVRIGAIRGAAGRCVRFRAGRMPRFSVPCGCRSVRSCAGESFMRSDMRLSAAVRRGRFGRQKASSACFHRGGEEHCPRLSVSAFLFVRGSPDRTRNTLLAISKNSPGTGKFGSEELHIAEFSLHLHSRFPYFRHTECPDGGIGRRVGLKHQ